VAVAVVVVETGEAAAESKSDHDYDYEDVEIALDPRATERVQLPPHTRGERTAARGHHLGARRVR
jgi:hypothetical protein